MFKNKKKTTSVTYINHLIAISNILKMETKSKQIVMSRSKKV